MDFLKKMKKYEMKHPEEGETILRFVDFIKDYGDNAFLRTNLVGHITGSCLILSPNKDKVLLTHHKKLNMWLQLGGHGEGECDPYYTAHREAEEESGIESLIEFNDKEIVDIDRHIIPSRKLDPEHYHYDVRYVFTALSEETTVSDESNDLKWFSFDELKTLDLDKSLIRLISKTKIILSL